jgi:hypothetical protein
MSSDSHQYIGVVFESAHLVAQITRWPDVALEIFESRVVVPILRSLLFSEVRIAHEARMALANLCITVHV